MSAVWVVLGAAVGAPLRYLLDQAVQARHRSLFPWGTFTVNVVGCAVLGLLAGLALTGHTAGWVPELVGTGFCGALSTYSTFGYETRALAANEARTLAVLNAAGSVLAGFGAAATGLLLGLALAQL
ncbi:CrcB protein [Pseudonocardia ammonioxydans]|uniref:Fluoride-specific ion channel FluC n=1 Tax=Pseudonocardia ammonioxydans TaxID=260086 RepID=A0A1I5IGA0_PSUAM|nr:fluoride efflux transporter CrcB [Pseudonocardia ammonioxydans]SFO59419.1 CrcB protein [Pseudonocardia ammonioxydans]